MLTLSMTCVSANRFTKLESSIFPLTHGSFLNLKFQHVLKHCNSLEHLVGHLYIQALFISLNPVKVSLHL